LGALEVLKSRLIQNNDFDSKLVQDIILSINVIIIQNHFYLHGRVSQIEGLVMGSLSSALFSEMFVQYYQT